MNPYFPISPGTWSASTSPARSPSPTYYYNNHQNQHRSARHGDYIVPYQYQRPRTTDQYYNQYYRDKYYDAETRHYHHRHSYRNHQAHRHAERHHPIQAHRNGYGTTSLGQRSRSPSPSLRRYPDDKYQTPAVDAIGKHFIQL